MGRPPMDENEKLSAFSIRISPALKAEIAEIAKMENRSVNNMIAVLLQRSVKQYHEEHSTQDYDLRF